MRMLVCVRAVRTSGVYESSGDDEELHALIVGDREEDVERAAAAIRALLATPEEVLTEHKRAQLRELAAINGACANVHTVCMHALNCITA